GSPTGPWALQRAAASPFGPIASAGSVAASPLCSDARFSGRLKRACPRRNAAETPPFRRQATTALPSAATATRGSYARCPAADRACALPQWPAAEQVAARTWPALAHAAVTAERPSTASTGFAPPRPLIGSAAACPKPL